MEYEYHLNVTKGFEDFLSSQVAKHKNVESIEISEIENNIESIESEIKKSNDVMDSLNEIDLLSDSILQLIDEDLGKSFSDFKNYISKEVNDDLTIDDTILIGVKEKFNKEYNELIKGLISELNDSKDDFNKFKEIKIIYINGEVGTLERIKSDINNYIKIFDVKKDEIKTIIQTQTRLKNQILKYRDKKYKNYPSTPGLLNIEESINDLTSVKISQLIKLSEEQNEVVY